MEPLAVRQGFIPTACLESICFFKKEAINLDEWNREGKGWIVKELWEEGTI